PARSGEVRADLTARRDGDPPVYFPWVYVDAAKGTFRIGPIEEGPLRLYFLPHAAGVGCPAVDVRAPAHGVVLRTVPAHALRVRAVPTPERAPLVTWNPAEDPMGQRFDRVLDGPTMTLVGVPEEPGTLLVRDEGDDRFALRRGVLPSAQPIDVALELG